MEWVVYELDNSLSFKNLFNLKHIIYAWRKELANKNCIFCMIKYSSHGFKYSSQPLDNLMK